MHVREQKKYGVGGHCSRSLPSKQTTLCPVPSDQGTRSSQNTSCTALIASKLPRKPRTCPATKTANFQARHTLGDATLKQQATRVAKAAWLPFRAQQTKATKRSDTVATCTPDHLECTYTQTRQQVQRDRKMPQATFFAAATTSAKGKQSLA